MKDKTNLLGEERINKLLFRLSLPATTGMIVMSLYNIVDTIFVGRGVGAIAIGGLAIVFPIQMLVNSVALTIGIGGASIISRALGAKNIEKADKTFGNLITLVLILSIVITPLIFVFCDELLVLFGAKGQILFYAKEYYKIVLWGAPFISFAMMCNNIIRAEGKAKIAMYTMIVAAIINLVFDPIFIFGLHLGIKGAAWATLLSQISGAIFVLIYYLSGKSIIRLSKAHFRLQFSIVKETFAIGIASFSRHASNSIMAVILNHSLIHYGGEISVAIFGIVQRLMMIFLMPMFGILQGFLPIIGYNFGANDYRRVMQVIKSSQISSTAIGALAFIIVFIFTEDVISLFTNELEVIENGKRVLRLLSLAFPLLGFQIIGAGFFQALGKALPSFFLSLSRQIIFLIPLVVILPLYYQLNGIWYSFPIADTLAFFVTSLIFVPHWKKIRRMYKMKSVKITAD